MWDGVTFNNVSHWLGASLVSALRYITWASFWSCQCNWSRISCNGMHRMIGYQGSYSNKSLLEAYITWPGVFIIAKNTKYMITRCQFVSYHRYYMGRSGPDPIRDQDLIIAAHAYVLGNQHTRTHTQTHTYMIYIYYILYIYKVYYKIIPILVKVCPGSQGIFHNGNRDLARIKSRRYRIYKGAQPGHHCACRCPSNWRCQAISKHSAY